MFEEICQIKPHLSLILSQHDQKDASLVKKWIKDITTRDVKSIISAGNSHYLKVEMKSFSL